MINLNETITIGWCDNGLVDGKFVEGLMQLTLQGPKDGIQILSSLRVQGNQIGRQRQILFDYWADHIKTDWLLWVDSDICISLDILKQLLHSADKVKKPIVSGVYFISKTSDTKLIEPLPVIFNDIDKTTIEYIHPLPHNQLIKIDSSGMGLVLMNKSIIVKLRKKFINESLFAEKENIGNEFVSEDISFFRKVKEVGIPVYAHTGAIASHIKRFSLDTNYYQTYWNLKTQE
jgi:hypothetical protein